MVSQEMINRSGEVRKGRLLLGSVPTLAVTLVLLVFSGLVPAGALLAQTVGPEDRLVIIVEGHPALSDTVAVRPDGSLEIPGTDGVRLPVAGRPLSEVRREIRTVLEALFGEVTVEVDLVGEGVAEERRGPPLREADGPVGGVDDEERDRRLRLGLGFRRVETRLPTHPGGQSRRSLPGGWGTVALDIWRLRLSADLAPELALRTREHPDPDAFPLREEWVEEGSLGPAYPGLALRLGSAPVSLLGGVALGPGRYGTECVLVRGGVEVHLHPGLVMLGHYETPDNSFRCLIRERLSFGLALVL